MYGNRIKRKKENTTLLLIYCAHGNWRASTSASHSVSVPSHTGLSILYTVYFVARLPVVVQHASLGGSLGGSFLALYVASRASLATSFGTTSTVSSNDLSETEKNDDNKEDIEIVDEKKTASLEENLVTSAN